MYYFIVNTHSSSGLGWEIWDKLKKKLADENVKYEASITEYAEHARILSAEIQKKMKNEDVLVVVGGDGSLSGVVDGLDLNNHNELNIGFIPTGSGNDFARGMELEKEPLKALDKILYSKSSRFIDIGEATFRCDESEDSCLTRRFAVSAGIGYDAAVCEDLNNSKIKKFFNFLHLGKLSYFVIGFVQWLKHPKVSGTICFDGGEKKPLKKLDFISAHNQKYEGGGYPFAPLADPSDGKLSVCTVDLSNRIKFFFALLPSKNFVGFHLKFKGVSVVDCERVDIELEKPLSVHTDGETPGHYSKATFKIIKNAIKIIS